MKELIKKILQEETRLITEKKKKKSKTKKDACYHKVKARYDVWPSAYASGALSKCRKVGASNWGKSTTKEEFELQEKRKGLDPKNPKFKKSIDSLKEKMQKTGRPRPKGRKKLMGGGSSSSREAMMHGFYNKDMGMDKKKK